MNNWNFINKISIIIKKIKYKINKKSDKKTKDYMNVKNDGRLCAKQYEFIGDENSVS